MSFSQRFFQTFALAAVLLSGATAASASQTASATMPLGALALPPVSYVAFCERQPEACGPDAGTVLSGAARAQAERAALLSGSTEPVDGAAAPAAAAEAAPVELPALTPALWRQLNQTNVRVNRAIKPAPDLTGHGVTDLWTLPLAEGRKTGDCEDYALEKIRTLAAQGVPRSALNIALAVTGWGESHAVLVVSTRSGDFVLDNLTPSVTRWDAVPYRWRQRQVGGEAFRWAMVKQGARIGG